MNAPWLVASGEMADRIRTFDWSQTPLGSIEGWSPALRTAVGFMLNARQPVFLGWGPDAISLYNDSIVPIVEAKHPSSLGKPHRELFAEVWEEYEPILARTMAGEPHYLEDQPIRLAGRPEHDLSYFTYSWTPLHEADGTVAGFLCVATETTDKVRSLTALRESTERQTYLLEFADALRPIADPVAVQEVAARMLGEQLQVDRCYYAEFDWPRDLLHIYHEYVGAASFSVVGSHPISLFQNLLQFSHEGEPLVCSDIATHPIYKSEIAAYRERGTDGFVLVPLVKQGTMVACMCVTMATPRAWSSAEVELVGEVAERTWSAVERARAEAALRESEARHSLLIESWAQAVWEADAQGVVIADSPSWRAYTGQTLEEWLGYGWLNAIHPDDRAFAERQWREAIAVRGLVDAEFRLRAPDGGWRWTNVRAAPVLDAGGTIEKWVGMNIDIDARKRADAAMRESEEKYRSLFGSMDEAYAVVEVLKDDAGRWVDFRFLDANPAFMEHTAMPYPVGRTATELLGSPNPRWTELYGQALDAGEPIRVEESEPTLGRTFDLNIFALERERNRVAVLFTDITERKRAETALRERETDLARVQRIGEVGGLDIDVANGLRSKRSPEYLRLHGLTAASAEETHEQWRERVHPDDRDEAEHALFAALGNDGASYESEYRIVRPSDGAVRWIHARADIERDADGRPVRLVGAHLDITEQRRVQEALRISEERLRGFGEASTDVLWIREAETLAWTYLTPAFEAIYGMDRDAALGGDDFRTWLDLILPEDRDTAQKTIQRVLDGEDMTFEYRVRRPNDGGIRWLRNTDFPIRNAAGRVVAIGGVGHDATKEKEAEESIRDSEAQLQVLVAELQHRTRNLIGVISMIMRQMVASSTSLADFRSRFTERLEALSRVQGLFARKDDETIGIGDIVRLELEALGADLNGEQVRIEGGAVPVKKSTVQTLALAIHELATNARKYGALRGERGLLVVQWEAYATEVGKRRLRFEWTETGIDADVEEMEGPLHRGGYGRKLIEQALPYTLKARTTYSLGRDRLDCTVDMPLAG